MNRLAKLLYRQGWNRRPNANGIRRRIFDLVNCRYPWWDWGHRVMIFTGSDFGGNWQEPTSETWWYRAGQPTRMWRTGYPRTTNVEIISDYRQFMALTEGMVPDDDAHYEWRAIGFNQDDELHLGRQFWGMQFHGLSYWELPIVAKYLRRHRRRTWFGVRPWLYSQALHSAVSTRKPFACNAVPPSGSGGYDHWHCGEKRRHLGPHRFGNSTWNDGGKVGHSPQEVTGR